MLWKFSSQSHFADCSAEPTGLCNSYVFWQFHVFPTIALKNKLEGKVKGAQWYHGRFWSQRSGFISWLVSCCQIQVHICVKRYDPKWWGVALWVLINRYLRKRIDGIFHQYEIANWSWSTDHSRYSTGLFQLSRLVLWLPSPDDIILAESEIHKRMGTIKLLKFLQFFVMSMYN